VALAAACCSSPGLAAAPFSPADGTSGTPVSERTENYGRSVQGRPLVSYVLGAGANKTMLFGGFHGNERSVPGVVNTLRRYLKQHPQQWPHCTVILVPEANPDGWAAGTRVNAKHIDINRNFPTRTWKPVGRTGRDNPGPYAGSEPETQAIIRLVKKYSPTKIISIHQPLHLLNWTGIPGKKLAEVMQKANGYRISGNIGYPTPGAFGDYCGEQSIALVTMEIPNQSAAHAWAKNRAALLAAIRAPL
jgi:protein MpaA